MYSTVAQAPDAHSELCALSTTTQRYILSLRGLPLSPAGIYTPEPVPESYGSLARRHGEHPPHAIVTRSGGNQPGYRSARRMRSAAAGGAEAAARARSCACTASQAASLAAAPAARQPAPRRRPARAPPPPPPLPLRLPFTRVESELPSAALSSYDKNITLFKRRKVRDRTWCDITEHKQFNIFSAVRSRTCH